jgi:hypothetical protein
LNLNSRLAGHKLGKPNLYETAIKANKNRFAELVCVRSYFITKWRGFSRDKTKKALRLVGVAISTLPPEKQLGFAPQNPNFPNKNRRVAPESVEKFVFGANVRRSSNLFPRKSLKLSPDACGRETPAGPTRKTLCFIFLFPPAEFLFCS